MPCRCNPTVIVDPHPCPDCIIVRSLLVSCTNSPDPCGDTGVVDLGDYNNVAACAPDPVVYSVESYDMSVFSSVTINPSTGVLTFVTSGGPNPPGFKDIIYKVSCGSMSAVGYVRVCIKDLCAFANCEVWQTCDPCTGACIDLPHEISVTGTPQEISVT